MEKNVQLKYRLYRRCNGVFYWQDNTSKKQGTLRTTAKREAERQLNAVALIAGLASASVFAFLRVRFAFGDAAGNSAVAGEAAVSAGEAVASALLCWRCFFAGEGDSAGNSAGADN